MPHSIEDEAVATEAVDMATLMAENQALRDKLLRALADAENTRRRAERIAEDARHYSITDFARDLLTVADNLQRTLAAAEEQQGVSASEGAALLEGVRATARILGQVLERHGVRKIEAQGAAFDPNLHEAIMEVDDPSHPPGTVVEVMEDGYTIRDRLLRPARVVVAKRSSLESPSLDPQAEHDESSSRKEPHLQSQRSRRMGHE